MSRKHKNEAFLSTLILTVALLLFVAYFTVTSVRFSISDTYNSVFKTIITDRVLKDEANIYSNVAYCNSENPRQTLDLYVPRSSSQKPLPLVIFIHGGGWRAGDKSNQEVTYYGEHLLKNDVAVASINYRLYPEVTYPSPNEDVSCALAFLSTYVGQYNVSTDSWAVFGDSAGAQLGAYVMSDNKVNKPLKLFVGFYGPYDLPRQINRVGKGDGDAWAYTNKGRDAQKASPYYLTPKIGATYMLFHGNKDRIVSLPQSKEYSEKLKTNQINAIFTPVDHAGHYFSPRSNPPSVKIRNQITDYVIKM